MLDAMTSLMQTPTKDGQIVEQQSHPIPLSHEAQRVLRDCHDMHVLVGEGVALLKVVAEQALNYGVDMWSRDIDFPSALPRLIKRLQQLSRVNATRKVDVGEWVKLVKGGGLVKGGSPTEATLAATPSALRLDATYESFRKELRRRVSYDATDDVAVGQQTPRRGTAEAIAEVFGSTITTLTPEKRKWDTEALRQQALGDRRSDEDRLKREAYMNDRLERKRRELEEIAKLEDLPLAIADACKEPLTEAEDRIVNRALRSPRQARLVEAFNLEVMGEHASTLSPGQWLVDEVVNMYMTLLQKRDERICAAEPKKKTCHFFNSFFIARLMGQDASSYDYKGVARWTRKFDIFDKSLVVAPVNVGNMHWCLLVFDFEKKTIRYYDSMGGAGTEYLNAAWRYLEDESKDKKKKSFDYTGWKKVGTTTDTPRQMNGFDCGVFATFCAHYVAVRAPLKFSQSNIPHFRRRMLLDIMQTRINGGPPAPEAE